MPQEGSLVFQVGDPASCFMAALLWSVSLRRGAGKLLGRNRIKACLPKDSSVWKHEARITACLASSWKEWQTFQGQLTFEIWVHHPALLRHLPKGLSFDTWLNGNLKSKGNSRKMKMINCNIIEITNWGTYFLKTILQPFQRKAVRKLRHYSLSVLQAHCAQMNLPGSLCPEVFLASN